jgi:hypothetical protein
MRISKIWQWPYRTQAKPTPPSGARPRNPPNEPWDDERAWNALLASKPPPARLESPELSPLDEAAE